MITDGFICLDKFSLYDNKSHTLDQLEFHNFRFIFVQYVSKFIYRMMLSWQGTLNIVSTLMPRRTRKFFFGDLLHVKYPYTSRMRKLAAHFTRDIKSPVPNGLIMIKYWPIDAYQRLFDNAGLMEHVRNGYLLNDIAYFIDRKLVEVKPARKCSIDRENKVIIFDGKQTVYDHIIDGDRETPNLPRIIRESSQEPRKEFQYEYRDTYMEMLSKDLKNVYFFGYTRPSTGGASNIVEMQCLFALKLIADNKFNEMIYSDIDRKVELYNREYYANSDKSAVDYLVYYGYYTFDMANLLDMDPSLSRCHSINDVLKYYLTPNNVYKFRESGPYKVEGAKELSEKIWEDHGGFSFIKHFILNYFFIQITVILLICFLPFPIYLIIILVLIQIFNPFVGLLHSYGTGKHNLFNLIFFIGFVGTAIYPDRWMPVLSLLCVCTATFIFRKMGRTRLFFNDLKHKRKYDDFFERYVRAFSSNVSKKEKNYTSSVRVR